MKVNVGYQYATENYIQTKLTVTKYNRESEWTSVLSSSTEWKMSDSTSPYKWCNKHG